MSCGHEHGEHGGHGGHGHDDDDDHVKGGEGTLDFLYTRIDRDGVVALNEARPGSGARIIKPWDQRMDEEQVSRRSERSEDHPWQEEEGGSIPGNDIAKDIPGNDLTGYIPGNISGHSGGVLADIRS